MMEFYILTLGQFELKNYFIVFCNSWVSLPSGDDFFHDFTIAIDIDDCSPGIDPNYIHLYLNSFLDIVLFIDFKVF